MDVAHRQILDVMLDSPRWKHLAGKWDDAKRHELVMSWHKAQGMHNVYASFSSSSEIRYVLLGWPDATKGLYALKKKAIVAALSNGNLRFLVDLVCIIARMPHIHS